MYARAVDDAAARLHALRTEERGDLGLAVLALGLAVAATQVRPSLAAPLFVGGLGVGVLGLRALWRRWDLLERLAGERDAHVIPEVLAYATRETTMERRQTFAALVRAELRRPETAVDARLAAVADELEALASELEDPGLALDPAAAVACMRLLSDVVASPLLNRACASEELRSRILQIRTGFSPLPRPQPAASGHTPAASLG
jgi:signal transduction histidine kinase